MTMKLQRLLLAFVFAVPGLAAGASAPESLSLLEQAERQQADSSPGVLIDRFLAPALAALGPDANPSLEAKIRIMSASAYRELGMYREAATLMSGQDPSGLEAALRARYRQEQGRVTANADPDLSMHLLELARDAAGEAKQPALQASILNDLAALRLRGGNTEAAAAQIESARALDFEDPSLRATLIMNSVRVAMAKGSFQGIEGSLTEAGEYLQQVPQSRAKAVQLIGLGTLYRDVQARFGLDASWRANAFRQFDAGRQAAELLGDARLESFAQGYIGELYEQEERPADALVYARRAAFLAQQAGDNESLYRWLWLIARQHESNGDTGAAIVAYRQSIEALGRLKADIPDGATTTFRDRAGPVFFAYADLLLKRTAGLEDPQAVEANLREVRSTLEQVKVAEVQEYFEDRCVRAAGANTDIDLVDSGTAVIYPILLPDRTELLVSLPQGLRQFTTPVGSRVLTEEVRRFRLNIERYDGREEYLRHAQLLYQWLVEPLETALAEGEVKTLVMVPDGPLRTIPLTALHDGKQFLIERFAFATTPGLSLTSPNPLARSEVELLAGGLTLPVQGFSALPNVASELDNIRSDFPGQTIRDQEFVVDTVRRHISEGHQEIVHIATHGQFDSDHEKSFLLAYDDKLTMDGLQSTIASRRYQDEPLELLVLSACQTAAGDDRAALGLAGVALKAGARSALASLWFVNDESTAEMISGFYAQLGNAGVSKAQALQAAQIALIQQPRFHHPSFWAPFLLIGNWL